MLRLAYPLAQSELKGSRNEEALLLILTTFAFQTASVPAQTQHRVQQQIQRCSVEEHMARKQHPGDLQAEQPRIQLRPFDILGRTRTHVAAEDGAPADARVAPQA